MNIYTNLDEWRRARHALPLHTSLGFVPTMGHLHTGHLSLFARSQQENDRTIASIFINPTQFNQIEDYNLYPRTQEKDLELLEKQGVNDCILPHEHVFYADGYRFQLQENQQSLLMEGAHRPGHFAGVLTVVMKLLLLTKPHRAYFGEKDYQQYELIRDMAASFFVETEIKASPIIREPSGLAYSSRNTHLSAAQREVAYQCVRIFHNQSKSCEEIQQALIELGIDVDYVEDHNHRRYIAFRVGKIRLIDNILLSHA